MPSIRRYQRPGLSLLEVVLALTIGMLLLSALYVAMNSQLFFAQIGRDNLAEGALVRSLFTRMSNDIISQVGPVDPRVINLPNATTMTTPSTTTDASTASTTTPSTTGATTDSATEPAVQVASQVVYNLGVQGDSTSLTLSMYRAQKPPPEVLGATGTNPLEGEIVSDLRVVCYWMANNGGDAQGLARKEFRQATSDAINTYPPNLPDQDKCILAPEVSGVTFEYFDGDAWQTSWDGTALEEDQVTPIGPPRAIRITLTLRRNWQQGLSKDINPEDDQGATYQHIIALPTANYFQLTPTTPQTTTP